MMEIFNLFDKNHDGSIDIKELGDGMRALGANPTDAEIRAMMKEADSQCMHWLSDIRYSAINPYIIPRGVRR